MRKKLNRCFPWQPQDQGVFLSADVSLVRNLADIPFPGTAGASPEVRHAASRMMMAALEQTGPEEWFGINCNELPEREQLLLAEGKLLTLPLTPNQLLLIHRKSDILCRINAENSLEMRCFALRDGLESAYGKLNALEKELEKKIRFAFHRRFGYLTPDPANAGTGLTVAVSLHLPAMTLRKSIKTLLDTADVLGIRICGFFGETAKFPGNIYCISNRSRMGETEQEILDRMAAYCARLIAEEEAERQRMKEQEKGLLMDFCCRSKAVLQNAYRIRTAEAMNALSGLRLAGEEGIFDCSAVQWDELLLQILPGHLTEGKMGVVSVVRRAELRAEFLRRHIAEAVR